MLCSPNTVAVVECSSHAWAPAHVLIRYGTMDSRLTAQATNQATSHCTYQPATSASNRCAYDSGAPQPRRGRNHCARTTGLRAEIVYGGDIQSIVTDH